MNSPSQLLISITLLMALAQAALAVQPHGQSAPGPASVGARGIIERGGTIDAIDPARKSIVVDGVKFPFAASPLKIHWPNRSVDENALELKTGMQIRFHSSRDGFSGQEQVREIWVTSKDDEARPR